MKILTLTAIVATTLLGMNILSSFGTNASYEALNAKYKAMLIENNSLKVRLTQSEAEVGTNLERIEDLKEEYSACVEDLEAEKKNAKTVNVEVEKVVDRVVEKIVPKEVVRVVQDQSLVAEINKLNETIASKDAEIVRLTQEYNQLRFNLDQEVQQ